jgi:hypothetical protein
MHTRTTHSMDSMDSMDSRVMVGLLKWDAFMLLHAAVQVKETPTTGGGLSGAPKPSLSSSTLNRPPAIYLP